MHTIITDIVKHFASCQHNKPLNCNDSRGKGSPPSKIGEEYGLASLLTNLVDPLSISWWITYHANCNQLIRH